MKKQGCCCRFEKKPKHCAFRRAQPQGRARMMREKMGGDHNYKQAIHMECGGNYPKNRKF